MNKDKPLAIDKLELKSSEEISAASYGSTQLLKFAVGLKFYINGHTPPSGFYPGEFTETIASKLMDVSYDTNLEDLARWGSFWCLNTHKEDLEVFGVKFDTWTSERSLHSSKETNFCNNIIEIMSKAGLCSRTGKDDCCLCDICGTRLEIYSDLICYPCPNHTFSDIELKIIENNGYIFNTKEKVFKKK